MAAPHDTIPWRPYPPMDDAARIAAARAFHDAIAGRRTCREIGAAPIPRAVIEAAIAAAGTAPSGANHQPLHVAVITDPARKHEIRIAAEEEPDLPRFTILESRTYGAAKLLMLRGAGGDDAA